MKFKFLLFSLLGVLALSGCGSNPDPSSQGGSSTSGESSEPSSSRSDSSSQSGSSTSGESSEPSGSRYNVYLSYEPFGGGIVLGAGEYSKNANVTITAEPAPGYNFDGWFQNGVTPVTNSESYSFTMPGNDVFYIAKFSSSTSYILTINYDSSKGTVSHFNYADPSDHGPSYSPMTTVEIDVTVFPGASFVGLFDENDILITSLVQHMYIMPDHDVTIYAKFE